MRATAQSRQPILSYTDRFFSEDRILETIVSHLDNYGIVSLLTAFPDLQKKAILITDHEMSPMFFGGLHNVDRRLLSFPDVTLNMEKEFFNPRDGFFRKQRTGALDIYEKALHASKPIMLIEASLTTTWKRLVGVKLGMDQPHDGQIVDLTATSFVFISLPYEYIQDGCALRFSALLETRLDRYTDSKWHTGLPTYFPVHAELIGDIKGEDHQPCSGGWPVGSRWENLKHCFGLTPGNAVSTSTNLTKCAYSQIHTLRIDAVTTLPDGLYLPLVENLSVIFSEAKTPGQRPVIRDLFAPVLRVFVVHFTTDLPLFENCTDIGTTKEEAGCSKDEPMLFELADRRHLDHSRFNKVAVTETHKRRRCDPLELPFLLNFRVLIMGGGVSITLFRPQDLANINTAQFHFTECDYYDPRSIPQDWIIHMAALHRVRAHVTSSGIILPKITNDPVKLHEFIERQSYDEYSIVFTTLVDELHTFPRFWKHIAQGHWKWLSDFFVYSSPRLLKKRGFRADTLIQLGKNDWLSVFHISNYEFSLGGVSMTEPSQHISSLCVCGFVMDFLDGPTEVPLKVSACIIQPVITRRTNIVTCSILANTSRRITFLEPFTIDSDYNVPKKQWELDLTLNDTYTQPLYRLTNTGRNIVKLYVSTKFSKCSLNGRQLPLGPSKDWQDALYKVTGLRYHPRTKVLSHKWQIPEVFLRKVDSLQSGRLLWWCKEKHGDVWVKIPTAEEMLAKIHIHYSPYLKFANTPLPITVEHELGGPEETFVGYLESVERFEADQARLKARVDAESRQFRKDFPQFFK